MLHKETITPELLEVLQSLMSMDELATFQLVGGTAIALQLGHRKSIDIDLFSNKKVDLRLISRSLKDKFPELTNMTLTQTNVGAFIKGVRVDIYDNWLIPFRKPAIVEEGVRLSALEDLAAFKLSAIIGRREKKDYIDLYFLFKHLGGDKMLSSFKSYEPLLSDKSLLFALAEVDTARDNPTPMPEMLIDVNWEEIRELITYECRDYLKKLSKN